MKIYLKKKSIYLLYYEMNTSLYTNKIWPLIFWKVRICPPGFACSTSRMTGSVHPSAALGVQLVKKTCQGDTHQPKATMHSTCASWLSKPAAIPRPLLLCLARERLFSYMLKMHILSEYAQKDLIFFFFFF